jgi:predicted protein tyrosine phosphatase
MRMADGEGSFRFKVLFVCSRNRRRSLTAEHLFGGLPDVEVRSAGTQPTARIVVTEGLLGWADLILVMEKSHLRRLEKRYSEVLARKKIVALHIPDEFEYMQPELIDELHAKALRLMTRESDGFR